MRRLLKYLVIILGVVLLLLSGAIIVASNLFDSKVEGVVNKINQRQKQVRIAYLPRSSSILEKNALVRVETLGGKEKISAEFAVTVNFSFSSIKASFMKVDGSGNIDELLRKYLYLPTIKLYGTMSFLPWQLKGYGSVRTDAFSAPFEGGECRVGDSEIVFSGRSKNSLKVDFASAGVKCRGFDRYAGKDSFNLDFLGFKVKARPRFNEEEKTISLDGLDVSFEDLDFESSTIYMIGFSPKDKVRDATLRDKFKVNEFNMHLSMDSDDKGRHTLKSEGRFNLYFGMPYVKEGKTIAMYDMSNMHYDLSLGAFSISKLMKALKAEEPHLAAIDAFSKPIDFKLLDFGFTHKGSTVGLKGFVRPLMDVNTGKLSTLNARLDAFADRPFVDEFVAAQYDQGLNDMLNAGMINISRNVYSTTLEVKGKDILLNGKPYNVQDAKDEDEDLEENKKDKKDKVSK